MYVLVGVRVHVLQVVHLVILDVQMIVLVEVVVHRVVTHVNTVAEAGAQDRVAVIVVVIHIKLLKKRKF